MASILLRRHLGSLRPCDAQGQEYIAKLKPTEFIRVDPKRVRNPKQHRLYWAAIGLCFQHQSLYATQDDLHAGIKVSLGYCMEIQSRGGKIITIPKSIAFGNMPQDAWEEFFNAFIKLICERIIPNTNDEELRAELESMVGVGDPSDNAGAAA